MERTTEAAGREVGRRLAAGETFGPARRWAWHKDAEGKTCAYVSLDATGGAAAGARRRRRPRGGWRPWRWSTTRSPRTAHRWAKPAGPRPPWQARYLAALRGAGHAWASRCGGRRPRSAWTGAERWIALSRRRAGLEDWLGTNFGRVEAVILDFYHAAEHLGDLAKAWHGAGTRRPRRGIGAWSHRLKHEGGQAMLEELRGAGLRGRGGRPARCWRGDGDVLREPGASDGLPERTVAKGWQIGSGPVESACKTVVGQRLKGAGMRWGERARMGSAISAPCS